MKRAALMFFALAASVAAPACPCDAPPTLYKVTPAMSWATRPGYRCVDTALAGDVTCACDCCADGLLNGLEADIDCGGLCSGCDVGKGCVRDSDCSAGLVCQGAHCAGRAIHMFGPVATDQHWKLTVGPTGMTISPTTPLMPNVNALPLLGLLNNKLWMVIRTAILSPPLTVWSWDLDPSSSWVPFSGDLGSLGGHTYEIAFGASAVVFQSKMYILGAFTTPGYQDPVGVHVFDGTAFALGPSLPQGHSSAAATVHGSKIWIAGGVSDYNGPFNNPSSSAYVSSVHSWDADPGHSWVAGPPLQVASRWPSAAVLNGKWFIFGGQPSTGPILTTIQIWDFNEAGAWTLSSQTLPSPEWSGTAVAYGNRIYMAAGNSHAVWSWSGSEADSIVIENSTALTQGNSAWAVMMVL